MPVYLNFPDDHVVDLGTIETEETVVVTGVRNLKINGGTIVSRTQGHGTTPYDPKLARHWPRNRSHLRFVDCPNLTVRNVTIVGSNLDGGVNGPNLGELEAQAGIDLLRCPGAKISACTTTQTWGDGIYLNDCDGFVVAKSTITKTGRQGIVVVDSSGGKIYDNTFGEIRRSVIDLEPNNNQQVIEDIRIRGNTVASARLTFVASHGRGLVNDVVVLGNKVPFIKVNVKSSAAGRRKRWTVRDNVGFKGAGGYLMQFEGVDGVRVEGNVQAREVGKRQKPVIIAHLRDCTKVKVAGNSTDEYVQV